jgi:signal transduction histidine kinase/ligand-binding sensor domain-containing protein/DNA-binding response OmpR family regulator
MKRYVLYVIVFLLMSFGLSPVRNALSHSIFSDVYHARFKNLGINNGLSQSFISDIQQDSKGLVWIGTKDGLNMYDGYSFRIFRHNPFNPNSISDNFIKKIYCDPSGRIWIGTLNGGLNLYDPESDGFIRFEYNLVNGSGLSSNHILSISSDAEGNIWVGTQGGGLNKLHLQNKNEITAENVEVIQYINRKGIFLPDSDIVCLIRDSNNVIWAASDQRIFSLQIHGGDMMVREISIDEPGFAKELSNATGRKVLFEDHNSDIWFLGRRGLFKFDRKREKFKYEYFNNYNPLAATSLINNDILELWISTENGLTILQPESGQINHLKHNRNNPDGIINGNIISMLVDHSGTLWIGSNGYGLSLYDPYAAKFLYPDNYGFLPENAIFSVRDLSIRSLYETIDGTLWIGTNDGFYFIDRNTYELVQLKIDIQLPDDLFSIIDIQGDENGILWLGTNAGLIKFDPKTKDFRIYPTGLRDERNSSEPRVSKVYLDDTQIWVLTPHTIALFDKHTGEFDHIQYNHEPCNKFSELVYPDLYDDGNGNFWIGTHSGLFLFHKETRLLTQHINNPANIHSLPFNDIRSILPDPYDGANLLWLATGGGGLVLFDINNKKFETFASNHGLINNMVYGMLSDDTGNFWLSTNHGLSKFNVSTKTFTNYSIHDGLQSNEFNSGAYFKSHSGEMFFGGIRGYNRFFPDQIRHKEFQAPIVFTGFKILSDMVENKGPTFSVSDQSMINLKHNQNNFSIDFASLDFSAAVQNRFAYSFSRGIENWVHLGRTRSLTFTDVKPGVYTLMIKGTNNDGIWSDHIAVMKIHVARPWWTHSTAFVFYFFLLAIITLIIRKYELSRMNYRNQMQLADLEARKLKDLNMMKSRFFANISHELRTPLVLIKGPVKLLMEQSIDANVKNMLGLIHNNTLRLLDLINQMLDLSKLESGEYKLNLEKGNIIPFVKGYIMSFSEYAAEKNITMKFLEASSVKHHHFFKDFYYDKDIVGKILANLLSNAIKFTPRDGVITVTACIRRPVSQKRRLELTVKDTGIGIPADKLPFIYDRFFQVDDSPQKEYQGSGIGLAYVKELVELHKIRIGVISKPGVGTVFRLGFGMDRSYYGKFADSTLFDYSVNGGKSSENEQVMSNHIFDEEIETLSSNAHEKNKPVILIVEDHPDVIRFIADGLGPDYTILEAHNARQGMSKAVKFMPDLILSDIMMPGMDGFEFCSKIKSDEKTSQIPIILLTARVDEKDRITGLESGADDYLIKPFSSKELKARINNLIDRNRKVQERNVLNTIMKPGEIRVYSRDTVFLDKLRSIIDQDISNEKFNMDDLARSIGMSQSQLHRKIKSMTNLSAHQFVRSIKMNRAKEMLEKDAGTISEIAYFVGFSDPGYFSKTFRTHFGILPSEVKKNNNLEKT